MNAAQKLTSPGELIKLFPPLSAQNKITIAPVTSNASGQNLVLHPPRPELLAAASQQGPQLLLHFQDGLCKSVPLADVIDAGKVKLTTLRLRHDGAGILVDAKRGSPLFIEADFLRYLADEQFAAKVDALNKAAAMSRAELADYAHDNPPPPEWYAWPPRELTHEAWK